MKSKGKKTGLSDGKKAKESDQKWSDKKKNIKIRKEALKKIIDHFDHPDKKNHNQQK